MKEYQTRERLGSDDRPVLVNALAREAFDEEPAGYPMQGSRVAVPA